MSSLHAWTLEYQMLGQGQVKATLEEAFPAKKKHTCTRASHAPITCLSSQTTQPSLHFINMESSSQISCSIALSMKSRRTIMKKKMENALWFLMGCFDKYPLSSCSSNLKVSSSPHYFAKFSSLSANSVNKGPAIFTSPFNNQCGPWIQSPLDLSHSITDSTINTLLFIPFFIYLIFLPLLSAPNFCHTKIFIM